MQHFFYLFIFFNVICTLNFFFFFLWNCIMLYFSLAALPLTYVLLITIIKIFEGKHLLHKH